MGLLHHAEREIGVKNTMVAIQICFSMTDVYRSEVLAAVLNQISEDANLPMVFMRTVIMAVSTYKSLSGYVARNLLSRLITKRSGRMVLFGMGSSCVRSKRLQVRSVR